MLALVFLSLIPCFALAFATNVEAMLLKFFAMTRLQIYSLQ
jgi:hypothetical protein